MESQMGKILWNATKMGLLYFAVGAALAYAVPYIGVLAGVGAANVSATTTALTAATKILEVSANPVYLGLLFGGFGVLAAALTPTVDFLFGKDGENQAQAAQKSEIRRETAPVVQVHIHHDAPNEEKTVNFSHKIKNEREQQVKEIML
jgi:hypothetical protein